MFKLRFDWYIIHRFLCSLMCGDCTPQFHVRVCEIKFQFTTRGNWSSKWHATSYSIVFGSLQSLPCIFCSNQTKKTFQRWNAPSLFKLVWSSKFLFLPFKLFISSQSLWSNSTHPDKLSRVKNSKACRHTKYGNWIQSQAGIKYKWWKSKMGYSHY